jgi:hypothetical protein
MLRDGSANYRLRYPPVSECRTPETLKDAGQLSLCK